MKIIGTKRELMIFTEFARAKSLDRAVDTSAIFNPSDDDVEVHVFFLGAEIEFIEKACEAMEKE